MPVAANETVGVGESQSALADTQTVMIIQDDGTLTSFTEQYSNQVIMRCLIISKVGSKIAMPVADDKTFNLGDSLLLWLTHTRRWVSESLILKYNTQVL